MAALDPFPMIAVDVGNSRVKLGRFEGPASGELPKPTSSLQIAGDDPALDRLASWLAEGPGPAASWWIGSVNRPTASRLLDWLHESGTPGADRIVLLAAGDLPLHVALERPDMVGIDRLLDAVAANRLRRPDRPAVVVDIGSAITVDAVSAEGAFLGGAIAPGVSMSARALHAFTDLLPLVEMRDLEAPPEPIGTSTVPAMRAGLFWGAVGTIRELVARQAERLRAAPQVYLTGGAGPAVAALLGPEVQHIPHLTLAGIALSAQVCSPPSFP